MRTRDKEHILRNVPFMDQRPTKDWLAFVGLRSEDGERLYVDACAIHDPRYGGRLTLILRSWDRADRSVVVAREAQAFGTPILMHKQPGRWDASVFTEYHYVAEDVMVKP